MDTTRQLIERFFASLDSRDWAGFAEVLHPEVIYEIPQSRERIRGRDRYVQFNAEFPGDWHVTPTVILVDGADGVGRFQWRVGDSPIEEAFVFFTVRDGLLAGVTDFWPEPYDPPAGREHLTETLVTSSGPTGVPTVLVVDMANVLGAVPDGWWRDRAGATERLLNGLVVLSGAPVTGPDGDPIRLSRILAVLEGKANSANDPEGSKGALEIVRGGGSGDDEIAAVVSELVTADHRVLVVTADRGLRARLPTESAATGPGWLNALLGRT